MRLQTFWRALRDIKSRSRDKVPKTGRLPQNLSGMRNTLTAHPTCHQGTEQELTLQKKSMRPAAVSSSFASPSACVGAWRTGARFWFTSFWQTVLQHTTFPRYLSLLHVWRATSQKDDYSHGGNGKLGSRPASRRSQKHPPGQKIHAWVTSWKRLADGFAAHTTLSRYLSLLHVLRATSQKDDHSSHGGNGKLGV